jgi:hydrogenase/urease accessory protein HupE
MASMIYSLCAIAALLCALLLLRAYHRGGYRLLLWSGLCFVGLTLNNLALVVDKIFIPDVDLSILRTSLALAAMTVLIYGLIWDAE